MSRLDWERHRRQTTVWQRGAEPASKDFGPPTGKSEEVRGYVTRSRYSDAQEAGKRVRAAGNRQPSLVPTLVRHNLYAPDWGSASRLLIEAAANVEPGQCFVLLHGRRQILFGQWSRRFVAVATDSDLTPRQRQGLDLAGFRAESETFHKGTWFVYHKEISDHSHQALLIAAVLRDAWRLRMPSSLVVAEVFVRGPG